MKPKKQKQAERFDCDLTVRSFQFRAESINEDQRTVEAVIATEAPVLAFDYKRFETVYEILLMDGCRIPSQGQIGLFDTHNKFTVRSMLGSSRNLRIEGDKLIAMNVFSRSAEVDHAWTLVKEGHLTDNSVGYRVHNHLMIEPGRSAEVKGRSFTAPVERALRVSFDWEVRENSVCGIGADASAKNRSEANELERSEGANKQRKGIDMNFENWLQERGYKLEELEDGQRDLLRRAYEHDETLRKAAEKATRQAESQTEDGQRSEPDLDQVRAEAVRTELDRQISIRNLAELAGIEITHEEVVRCMTDPNVTFTDAQRALKKVKDAQTESQVRPGAPGIIVRDSSVSLQLLEDGIGLRAGLEEILVKERDGERRCEQADRLRDMSLSDVCRMAISLSGNSSAFMMGRDELVRTAFSTSSLSTILGNIANKSMLRGYALVEETWQKFCSVGTATDYKTKTKARMVDTIRLAEVGEGGEVTDVQFGDEKEQYHLVRYAKKFTVDDMTIRNDDMDALSKVPTELGKAAKLLIGDLVVVAIIGNPTMGDGTALFHSSHNNLRTTSPLTDANLEAALTAFKKQEIKKGTQKKRVRVRPQYLWIPPDLEFAAKKLVNSSLIVVAGSTDVVRGDKNVLQNVVDVLVEDRLSDSYYAGANAQDWYLIGDRNLADTVVVEFLDGRQSPTLERFQQNADKFGFTWRVKMDAVAKAMDWRNIQKNDAA